jgi:peptidoglycan/LPS O-acetylase OafA/YrhL
LLLQEQARSSTIQLREFYVRRAYRILPAAIAFMLPVFVIYWGELRWYHMAAAALYVTNFDPGHPWFLGHLWSLSVEEQFYFLWPGVLKKWHRHRTAILVGVILFAPVYRFMCHLLKLHGRADETFPAVADVLAIGCLLAIFAARLPRIKSAWAWAMVVPVALVPVYVGAVHFRTTAILLLVLWPLLHFSIAGLVLHVVQTPYWILNVKPVVWLARSATAFICGSSCLLTTLSVGTGIGCSSPWGWPAFLIIWSSSQCCGCGRRERCGSERMRRPHNWCVSRSLLQSLGPGDYFVGR